MAPFAPHTRMISWDIKNFYPNCETRLCIEAVRKALDKLKRRWSKSRKECICEAVEITMTSNNGCIAWQFFSQIERETIGGPDSASITDIFGGQFIGPVGERGMKTNAAEILKLLDWRRYRDDTFDIEIGELANPENVKRFTSYLNEEVCKGKNVFEPDSDPNQLVLLDTRVNFRGGFIRPVIYSKPTDAHRYLDPVSCHPTQLYVPGAISLSVGLRVRRNCSDHYDNDQVFVDKLRKYKGYLLDWYYQEEQVNQAFFKAFKVKRHLALIGKKKTVHNSKPKINFVTDFDSMFPDINKILNKQAYLTRK